MKKLYFTSLFILFFSFGFSQSYPYLNASTGNGGEFPVDKDTNIYMFHGNRLVKTDKNFNTVWANTYTGINSFTRLLLSKTGGIYFIGTDLTSYNVFGKLNANGTINWVKPIKNLMAVVSGTTFTSSNGACLSIMLDRNNNLVVTGSIYSLGNYPNIANCYYLKSDTNGAVLKFKAFQLDHNLNFSILSDSAGVYKFVASGNILSGTALSIYRYSDISDSFINSKTLAFTPMNSSVNWQLIKSKISNAFYIKAIISTSITNNNGMIKLDDNGQVKWSAGFSSTALGFNIFSGGLEEDNKGDLFYSISCGPTCSSYTSAFVKMDSNGVANTYLTTMLNGYYVGTTFPPPVPAHSQRTIHSNNYYFDISGYSFPTNPLTIQKFNSSLLLPCASTISLGGSVVSLNNYVGPFTPTTIPISSFTIATYTASATPITFSVNPNFCTVLNVNGIEGEKNVINIYPNPVSEKIYINEIANQIEIFDVNGKRIKAVTYVSSIDVSTLVNAIYFIRIKTDKGEFNKKFIKD